MEDSETRIEGNKEEVFSDKLTVRQNKIFAQLIELFTGYKLAYSVSFLRRQKSGPKQ